ncbi:MAG TPA: hypothetical protein PLP11_10115 [Bacteroidales bacterium]|nr:hypothetical protein [Bacteroidales bacterium]HQP04945.1 hypothetical protein [Bacteroidales bacterium]
MKTLIFLNILVIFMGCSWSNKGYEFNNKGLFIEIADTTKPVNLPNGSYYKLIYINEFQYKIEWGNRQIKNISKDTFDISGSGPLYLLESSNDFIILQQGCGMNCKYSVVLPLSSKVEEQTYIFTLALDTKDNLIAYLPEDQKNFIVVKNYLTGKVMEIEEDDLCPAASSGDCIDTCYFDKSCLIIKWQGSKWQSTQPDTKERKIKINI